MPPRPPTPPASSAGKGLGAPTKPDRVGTARLLQAHGLRPDTDLGQHFLLDENLVDLAVRQGRVGPDDVVLEIGPGVGTLTIALARAARTVHAVEIDQRLEPVLAEVLAGIGNVRMHWGDALRLDLETLDPAPTRVVANLPYSIATPIVLESLWRLPEVAVWAVMVQREVADRWAAPVGSSAYGAPSVLLQLACRSFFMRPVGTEVFMPRPRVQSAIVGLERIGAGPAPAVRALVHAAFAQRRKTLVNALAAAGADKPRVLAALESRGLSLTTRAQELAPPVFPELTEELAWTA
jgi:16S rRNA (adenine1518-N6/adenine1519-N6)-dimethyltransferase